MSHLKHLSAAVPRSHNNRILNRLEDDSTDTVPADLSSVLPAYVSAISALLLSAFFVLPGLFDTTLTSRTAIYPLAALIVFYGGRKHISRWAVAAAALLFLVPVLGMLWAPIPVQGIIPAVKWASFGLMIAGAAGIAGSCGTRPIWISLMITAVVVAIAEIFIAGDLIWGNPNRPGAILAAGFVIAVTGAASPKVLIRIPAAILIGIALILTSFNTAMIAACLALIWFIANTRRKFHPGFIIGFLLAGQILFTAAPNITERINPTLELRCRVWRAGSVQLLRNLPLGTGTGQSRLSLIQDAGERVQVLAGDPDRRIDHLHSDILTPVVEWGIAGLLLLFLAGWRIFRKRFTPLDGAILLCVWVLLAVDLPLATPFGALPLALCIGAILNDPSEKRGIRIPLPVLLVLVLFSLAWGVLIIRGYGLLERGRILGMHNAGNAGSVSEVFEETTYWIPFEERGWLFLAQAYLDDGLTLAGEEAAENFNRIYPGYWRGWLLQAQAEIVSGKNAEAAESYLNALRVSPVTLQDRNILALNAVAFPLSDTKDIVLLAETLITSRVSVQDVSIEVLADWIDRILGIAIMLPESEKDLAEELLTVAVDYLHKASYEREEQNDDIIRIMSDISDKADLIGLSIPLF